MTRGVQVPSLRLANHRLANDVEQCRWDRKYASANHTRTPLHRLDPLRIETDSFRASISSSREDWRTSKFFRTKSHSLCSRKSSSESSFSSAVVASKSSLASVFSP